MKLLLTILLNLLTFLSYSQNSVNLIPFYENGKWGYCDENLNRVIEPRFSKAIPFYRGLGFIELEYPDSSRLDEYYALDSNGTEHHEINYLHFAATKQAIIDSKGSFIIKPFIGSLEYNNEFIIINYGKLVWGSSMIDDENENPKEVYLASIETDSSWVINYKTERILKEQNGYFSFYNDNVFSRFVRDSANKGSFNRVGLLVNDKLIFNESILQNDFNCNDNLCWSVADSLITIYDLSGKKIGNYVMSENEMSYTKIPLDNDKIMFSWTDEYKIVNYKGDKFETKPLWLYQPEKIKEVYNLIENEHWRSPMKKYYKFKDGNEIIDLSKGSKMMIREQAKGDLSAQYFLVDKQNPERKLGPFIYCTSFYNGKAFVMDSTSLFIINQNGEFINEGIPAEFIEYPLELEKSNINYFREFVLVFDNKEKSGNRYYYHVSGKKYRMK